jgi:hypothetical protein
MSETASLPPGYSASPVDAPFGSYPAFPSRPEPSREASFVKQSKNRAISLQLLGQLEDGSLPIYGYGGLIEGSVKVEKADGVQSVEVKVRVISLFGLAYLLTTDHRSRARLPCGSSRVKVPNPPRCASVTPSYGQKMITPVRSLTRSPWFFRPPSLMERTNMYEIFF